MKCEVCNFMEKLWRYILAHTNYFKCGLCERNLDDSEKLGTHLNTCEMFVAEDVPEMKQPPQISKTMLKKHRFKSNTYKSHKWCFITIVTTVVCFCEDNHKGGVETIWCLLCFFRYFEVAPLQSQISHLNVPIVYDCNHFVQKIFYNELT